MDLREILTGLDKEENKIQLYNNCKQPIFLKNELQKSLETCSHGLAHATCSELL